MQSVVFNGLFFSIKPMIFMVVTGEKGYLVLSIALTSCWSRITVTGILPVQFWD